MGVYYAQGASGKIYPFRIKGAEISDTERSRIGEYLQGLGDPDEALIGGEGDKSAIGQAFGRGVDTLQLGFGSALEGLGKTTGLEFLEEFGEDVVETNKKQLAESEQYATRLDDVKDIGSGLDFFGQTLAEQAPQLGSTIGGSVVGAKIGAAGGPIGVVVGGIAGGLAANLPFFYGMNREAQKDESGVVQSEGIAALTAIPQASLDFIADRIVVGSLLTPAIVKGGGLFTRGVKGVGVGATVEVPTEVGQQVLERLQAGQDITSEEAIKQYKEVAVAAGLVGGTVRGTTQAFDNFDKKQEAKKKEQLEKDLSDLRSEVHRNAGLGQRRLEEGEEAQADLDKIANEGMTLEQQEQKRQQELEKITSGEVAYPINKLDESAQRTIRAARARTSPNRFAIQSPTITPAELRSLRLDSLADAVEQSQKGAVDSKPASHATTKRKFNQKQYDDAVQKVIDDGKADIDTIQSAAKDDNGDAVAPSVAEDIRDEMIANRVIRQAEPNVYVPLTEQEIQEDAAAPLRRIVSQEQKRLERLRKEKEKQIEREKKLKNNWKATPKQEQQLTESKARGDEIDAAIRASEARAIGLQRQVNTIESRTGAKGALDQQQYTQEQANSALEASRLASVVEQTQEYKAKNEQLGRQLAQDLKKLVGVDVALSIDPKVIETPPGLVVEGQYDSSKKLIALAMSVYDVGLTEQQRLAKLRGVLNHEVIDALRDIGLFTQAEYDSLVAAASKRKYTVVQNGTNVERDYTFVDRAQRINQKKPEESFAQYEERVHEEAVAEMFRSWADGRLKVAGKPLSLFKRIVNFFKGVQDVHADQGFNTVDSIFENISTGVIGQRKSGQPEAVKPRDRTIQADLSSIPLNNVRRIAAREEVDAGIQKSTLSGIKRKAAAIAGLHRLKENSLNPTINETDPDNPFVYTPLLNKEGRPIPLKKETALAILQEERGGAVLDPENKADMETIAQAFAAFAEPAIKRDASAIGWYEQKLRAAKEILHNIAARQGANRTVLSDPEMEAAFDFALAVTSNGMSVVENFEAAKEQIDYWSETGEFLVKGYGERVKAMEGSFAFYNALKKDGKSDLEIAEYLMEEHTVGEMKKHPLIVEYGLTVPSGELASERMPLAFLLGPKIGAGFYMNLRGDFDRLTADVWFMRLYNFITGKPFKEPKAADIQKNKDVIIGHLEEGPKNDFERRIISEVMADNDIDIVTEGNIEDFAVLLNRRFQREFTAASTRNTDKIKAYAAERGINWKSEQAKQNTPDLEQRPEKTDIFVKADTLTKQLSPQEQATPLNGTQRKHIRQAIARAREILKDGGYDINTADFQAVVWYPMKQIFGSMNVAKGSGSDNDYVDGAIALARTEGFTDAEIKEALPDTERERINLDPSATREDAGVRNELVEDSATEVAFDEGRTEEEVSEAGISDTAQAVDEAAAFTETLSQEDQDVVQDLSDQSRDQTIPLDVDFSSIAPEKPLQLALNPIAKRAAAKGDPSRVKNPSLFGLIKDNRGTYPVVVMAGQDESTGRTVPFLRDFGLHHMIQRNHLQEFLDSSKYTDLEQPIYDVMQAWAKQGYRDGPDVISEITNSAGGMRLTMERPPRKSPPIIVDLDFIPPSRLRSGDGIYTVATAFPREKNYRREIADRSAIPMDYSSSHLREAQNSIVYGKSYDVLKKALKLVTLGSEEKAEKAANTFGDLFQDRFLPIAQVVDKLRAQGATIDDAFDPYLQESLYHGRVGNRIEEAKNAFYEPAADRVKDLNLDEGTNYEALASSSDFVRQAEKESGSKRLAVVDAYLYALHAKERNAYISSINEGETAGSGMRDAEADAIINWVNSLDANNRQVLQDVRGIVRDIVADTNKVRVEGGLIPADFNTGEVEIDEEGNTVTAPDFQEYVPLRGILDPDGEATEEGSFGAARGQTFSIRGKEDRRMLGRSEYATSVLASVFMQNQNAVIRSEKNAVGKSFLDLIRAEPEAMSQYAVELQSPPMRRGLVQGAVKMMYDFQAKNDDSILVVKEGGKEILIKTRDPRVAKAMKGSTGASNQTLSGIVRGFGKINRYLSNINTTYNPEFLITNLVRDVQTAGVNVNQYEIDGLTKEIMTNYKSAFKGVRDVVRGMRRNKNTGQFELPSTITKEMAESAGFDINNATDADVFRLFQMYGGQNALNTMDTLQDQINGIKGVIGDIAESGARGKWNSVKNSFVGKGAGSILNLLDDYNTVVENAIRVATFKSLAPKIGFERAAFAARNVTVDFAKGGEFKPFMNSVYLFYNASLQGSFALINAATRSSKVRKIWVSTVMAGIILDQLNASLSEEDEDGELVFDKAPEYILEHNILLPDPFGVTDRSHISIPLPYGLNIGFNLGRSLSRLMRGGYDIGEAGSSIFMTAADALNPLGGTNNFFNFAAPTVADPFVDLMRNEEEFSGRPIVKETSPFDPTPPPNSQLYWSTTSPSLKWATDNLNKLTGGSKVESGLLDFSPDIIDYWLNYLTGGAGMFVNRTLDFTTQTIPTALSEGFEDEFVRQTPFLRKVFYSVSEREDVSGFIENRNKVLKAREVLEEVIKSRDPSAIRDVRSRYEKELSVFGQIRAINSARNRILRKLRQIDANPNLSDDQKEKATERLRDNLEALIQRGNKVMNEADI